MRSDRPPSDQPVQGDGDGARRGSAGLDGTLSPRRSLKDGKGSSVGEGGEEKREKERKREGRKERVDSFYHGLFISA